MSLPRFFLEEQVLSDEEHAVFPLRLSPDDLKHARVLRLSPGEHIAVVDATQDYFECKVKSISDDGIMASIAKHEGALEDGPYVILLQGLAKGDKMDTVIRQGTELGVRAFAPLDCQRSVVKLDQAKAQKRKQRWCGIAKSAAMQSGQPMIPEISSPMSIAQASDLLSGATAVIICWEEAPTSASLHDALEDAMIKACTPAKDARVAVVIGPEGGLTEEEMSTLLATNPRSYAVSLGSSILRTETAGVIAPALVMYELGCLGGKRG
ncbi:MAG: 16S rRNA (uracil(1498)-N(3))-methyltransferase [Eggerthellaceae bacterium]|nr:16S rRNA (uracil(1498)-N(3))-methyltransferase [Eggerthellaceae bacterium]